MSKVICDVCGTDYPETAAQCPICGCARGDGAQTSAGNTDTGEEERAYTYVKGGRFSKSNVRKRLKETQKQEAPVEEPQNVYDDEDDDDEVDEEREVVASNKGLIVIMILLLLAVIAFGSFLAIEYFGLGGADVTVPSGTVGSVLDATGSGDSTSDQVQIPCVDVVLTDSAIELKAVNSTWQLEGTAEPADTTDEMKFASSDESVATVDSKGLVTAVGNGEAVIRVTCGKITKECQVVCNFDGSVDVTTDPTDPSDSTDPTNPNDSAVLELAFSDVTLDRIIPELQLYRGELDPAEITWTSSKETVATVVDGLVTPVSLGSTLITAEYEGQTATCWIRVSQAALDAIKPDEPTESTEATENTEATESTEATEPTENTEPSEVYTLMVNGRTPAYRVNDDMNSASVTMYVGDSFTLTVENEMGARMDVDWTMSADGICTVDGRKVEGASAGKVTLTAEYEGQSYTCVIIVREVPEPETETE